MMNQELLAALRNALPKHYTEQLRKRLRGTKRKVSAQYISMVLNGKKNDRTIIRAAIALKNQIELNNRSLHSEINGEGGEA